MATQPRVSPDEALRKTSLSLVSSYAETNARFLQTKSEQELIDATIEVTRNQLKDPLSAQFRKVRVVPYGNGKVVCGEVNGKNSYGGYVGFKPFVGSYISSTMESTGRYAVVNDAANAGLTSACRA